MIVMDLFQLNILYDSMNLFYQVTGKHLKTIYDHTETLWANARRKVAHKIQKLVMSQSNRMSHIHVWPMPGFFRLFSNLWENMVVLKLSGEVLQDC